MASPETDLFGDAVDALGARAEAAGWTERHAEMIDLVRDELARAEPGLSDAQVRRLAVRVVARQCAEYGGAREYWPKVDAMVRTLRDAEIWAEHDGTRVGPRGITALARKHRLSEEQIWNILRAQRRLHVRRVQGRLDLPGG